MKYALIVPFLVLILQIRTAHAGFQQGYMSPQDIIRALYEKFDEIMISEYSGSCQYMPVGGDRNALGDINPASGEVAVPIPESSFLNWYNPCLTEYLNYSSGSYIISGLDQKGKILSLLEKMYAPLVPFLKSKCPRCDLSELARASAALGIPYQSLSEEQKRQYIANLVSWALGTDEEILSYGLITSMDGFRADLLQHANNSGLTNMAEINRLLVGILLKRDEFLQY